MIEREGGPGVLPREKKEEICLEFSPSEFIKIKFQTFYRPPSIKIHNSRPFLDLNSYFRLFQEFFKNPDLLQTCMNHARGRECPRQLKYPGECLADVPQGMVKYFAPGVGNVDDLFGILNGISPGVCGETTGCGYRHLNSFRTNLSTEMRYIGRKWTTLCVQSGSYLQTTSMSRSLKFHLHPA